LAPFLVHIAAIVPKTKRAHQRPFFFPFGKYLILFIL
jgi:hypothetical protein